MIYIEVTALQDKKWTATNTGIFPIFNLDLEFWKELKV